MTGSILAQYTGREGFLIFELRSEELWGAGAKGEGCMNMRNWKVSNWQTETMWKEQDKDGDEQVTLPY